MVITIGEVGGVGSAGEDSAIAALVAKNSRPDRASLVRGLSSIMGAVLYCKYWLKTGIVIAKTPAEKMSRIVAYAPVEA